MVPAMCSDSPSRSWGARPSTVRSMCSLTESRRAGLAARLAPMAVAAEASLARMRESGRAMSLASQPRRSSHRPSTYLAMPGWARKPRFISSIRSRRASSFLRRST